METESHCGMSRRPPHTTTMGAMAMMGTVWLATTYGMNARSASADLVNSTPSANPKAAPMANPTKASRSVQKDRPSRSRMRRFPPRRTGRNSSHTMSHEWGIVTLSGRTGEVRSSALPTTL